MGGLEQIEDVFYATGGAGAELLGRIVLSFLELDAVFDDLFKVSV